MDMPTTTTTSARNPVEFCPIEIWDIIFTLACDSRGTTAAAISQVSRYFYQAIKPYRLKSLAIYGESRLVLFHKAMEVMPPDVPRARHLFIGFIPESDVSIAKPVCDAVIDGKIQEIHRDPSSLTFAMYPQEYVDIQENAVGGIIYQNRMTLQTLTYLTPVNHIDFRMFGNLPNLKDLTIATLRFKSTFYEVHYNNPLCRKPQFPLLNRLHLSYFSTKPLFAYDEFRRVAPELTHLRISGRKCYPEMEELLSGTKVLLQPILLSTQEQSAQVEHIRTIVSNQLYRDRITLLEPGHRANKRYGFLDALSDWLDVSTGGNAFWDTEDTITVDELAARSVC